MATFAVNEKVMVPHTDKFYEAKVNRSELRNGPNGQAWYHFLHYTGWNKKYDEWVEEEVLVKCEQPLGEAGLEAPAAALGGAGPSLTAAGAAAGRAVAKTSGGGGGGGGVAAAAAALLAAVSTAGGQGVRKRQRNDTSGGGGGAATTTTTQQVSAPLMAASAAAPGPAPVMLGGQSLEVRLPALLKKALLDDYEAVVDEKRLVPLPRSPNVQEVLQMYVDQALSSYGSAEAEEEACQGLRAYFDKALHVVLLYQNERAQESQALVAGRVASCVYGTEHLLRLVVKLPDLLTHSVAGPVGEEQMRQMSGLVQDLVLWVDSRRDTLMLTRAQYVALEPPAPPLAPPPAVGAAAAAPA